MLIDIKQACRRLMAEKGLSLLIALSLAAGTSATLVLYKTVRAFLAQGTAAVARTDRLVEVFTSQPGGSRYGLSSYAAYQSIRAEAPSLSSASISAPLGSRNVDVGNTRLAVSVTAVSQDYFTTLFPDSAIGDALTTRGGDDIDRIVVSDRLPVGKGEIVSVSGRPYRVVDVAPPGFRGLAASAVVDAWIPIAAEQAPVGDDRRFSIIGRLRFGTEASDVESELRSFAQRQGTTVPTFTVTDYSPFAPGLRTRVRVFAGVLLSACALLLVGAVSCAGGLLLSATLARDKETSTKKALGVPRYRLGFQIVVESAILAATATVLALLLTVALYQLFTFGVGSGETQVAAGIAYRDIAILLFACFTCSALCATPSLINAPVGTDVLRGAGAARQRTPLRTVLIAAQVAVSTVLIVGSLWMVQALSGALSAGYSGARVHAVVASVTVADGRVELTRLRHLPGISGAGVTTGLPLALKPRKTFRATGSDEIGEQPVDADVASVSPGYFYAVNLPVLEGRSFRSDVDTPLSEAVAVVNETFARRYFPRAGAPGRVITDADGRSLIIVGVVRNEVFRALQAEVRPTVYYPLTQAPVDSVQLVLQAEVPLASVADAISRELADQHITPSRLYSFEEHVREALAADRMAAVMVTLCGALALIFAAIGVSGVAVEAARRRRREVAIRLALGATLPNVLVLVTREALISCAVGITAGGLAFVMLQSVARWWAFGMPQMGVGSLIACACVMLAAMVPIMLWPARRALRGALMDAMRAP